MRNTELKHEVRVGVLFTVPTQPDLGEIRHEAATPKDIEPADLLKKIRTYLEIRYGPIKVQSAYREDTVTSCLLAHVT